MQTAILFSVQLVLSAMESCASFLVYPRIFESRADDDSLLLHIHEGLTLSLEKTSILAENILITSSTDFDSDAIVLYGRELEKYLYHDTNHQAALAIKEMDGGLEVRGMLNPDLRIAPVVGSQRSDGATLHEVVKITERTDASSEQWDNMTSIEESAEDEDLSYSVQGDEMNIALVVNASSDYYADAIEYSPLSREDETSGTDETHTKRPKKHPMRFTVETCFVVDRKYESAFKDLYDLILYISKMLNAVALRFLDMTQPKVRFQLNKIIRNMSDIITNRTNNGTDVDAEATLDTMKEYARRGAFSHCDIAVYLTSEDLVLVGNNTIGRDVDGIAFIGGVCGDEKVGIVEDRPPTYEGVGTLAHEIAHILGANHDNTRTLKEFPGYPGAENCSSKDGYLMSYAEGGRKNIRLSNCSKDQIRFIYRNLSRSCINVSREACYSSDSYPGQNMTRRQFCQLLHLGEVGAKPARKNATMHLRCQIECCWKVAEIGLFCRYHSMAEGLKCAPGKTCRRGACAKHRWTRSRRSTEPTAKNLPVILPNKAV
uniref:Putative tick metalloprotease 1 n=1 Tax=Amblyomma cajennense TaxID=34607 RepID=A0A023FMP5_AMBCJ